MNQLNLKNLTGKVIKQGDFESPFRFQLLDYQQKPVTKHDGLEATVKIGKGNEIVYQTTATVQKGIVEFEFENAIPIGIYRVEIVVSESVYPSDHSVWLTVESSMVEFAGEQLYEVRVLNDEEIAKYIIENGLVTTAIDKINKLYQDSESNRQVAFEQSEEQRNEVFNTKEEARDQAESERQRVFERKESERHSTFEQNEAKRQSTFERNEEIRIQNEQNREETFNLKEVERQDTFNQSQINKQTSFDQSEQNRQNSFESSEQNRDEVFNQSQADRQKSFEKTSRNHQNTFLEAERLRQEQHERDDRFVKVNEKINEVEAKIPTSFDNRNYFIQSNYSHHANDGVFLNTLTSAYLYVEPDTEYTISYTVTDTNRFGVWASNKELPIQEWTMISDRSKSIRLIGFRPTAIGEKIVQTVRVPSDRNVLVIYLSNQKRNAREPDLKVEKGNRATPWTPAPEDFIGEFTKIKNEQDHIIIKLSNIESKVLVLESENKILKSRIESMS